MKMEKSFRDTEAGTQVFVGGSPQERLMAVLNPRLTSEPSREVVMEKAIAEAKVRVDSDPAWTDASALAETAIREGRELSAEAQQKRSDYRPDRFGEWENKAKDDHATSLMATTESLRNILDGIRTTYSASAHPMPITSADTGALAVRLNVLDSASPKEARDLIEDAHNRGDTPFLVAAGVKIRSWVGKRNSWSGADAEPIGQELIALIDRETWTPDRAAADYASDRAEMVAQSWALLAQILTKLGAGAEELSVHRQVGAFSPLLEPEG